MSTDTEPRTQLVPLEPSNRSALDAERTTLLNSSVGLPAKIETPDEYRQVADLEGRISAFIDRVEPDFDQLCGGARKVWMDACKIRGAFLDTPKRIKAVCRQLLSGFKEREEQARREEEQRRAEAERERATAQREADAKHAEMLGDATVAEIIRTTPVVVAPVALPSSVPDVDGLQFRTDWAWEPIGGDTPENRMQAIQAMVGADFAPFLELHDAMLTTYAKRTRGTLKLPGIRFFSRQVPVRK